MTIRSLSGLVLIIITLLTACKKEENVPLPENLMRLTNGSYKDWRLEKVTYILFNVVDQIPDCQRDEIYRFYSDGNGEVHSGPNPCPPADPDNPTPEPEVQATGSWTFVGQGEEIHINWQDKMDWEARVDELTDSKLVVTGIVFDNYRVTATFRPL
ncbi:hypothetical protein D770_00165 [Flammeovirgaceae bacterium 311]|nr:hypothetical protein D770_00165 [Flammeovirgaceae bacterium 311]